MYRPYQKLISTVVFVSFSILCVSVEGYAAAPTVKFITNPNNTEFYIGTGKIFITAQTSGKNLTYTWKSFGPGDIEGTGHAVTYLMPETIDHESVPVTITLVVADEEGNEATAALAFTLFRNPPPERPMRPEPLVEPEEETLPEEQPVIPQSESKGMSRNTKLIIGGVATAAAIGGGVALLAGGGDDDNDDSGGPFTGTFRAEYTGQTDDGSQTFDTVIFTLAQDNNSITGTMNLTSTLPGWCTASLTVSVNGTATGTSATLTIGSGESSCQTSDGRTYVVSGSISTYNVMLINDNNTLRFEGGAEFTRTAKIRNIEAKKKVQYNVIRIGGDFIRQ